MRSDTNTDKQPNHPSFERHQENVKLLIQEIQNLGGQQDGPGAVSSDDSHLNQADSSDFELSPAVTEKFAILIEQSAASLEFASRELWGQLLLELSQYPQLLASDLARKPVELVFQRFARCASARPTDFDRSWLAETQIDTVYRALSAEMNGRNYLLAGLASLRDPAALRIFADLLTSDPPADERGILIAFAPLISGEREYQVDLLFPKLLDGLRFKHLAAIILDLANYTIRKQLTSVHPAKPRAQQLTTLLGQVVHQLSLIEEGNVVGRSPEQISQSVNESVTLTVALCDALALAEYYEAIGKIRQALYLKHRRVKTEAAAALIRLGDTLEKEGRAQLIELAKEPICRLRVIAYATELELLSDLDPQYCTEAAKAESQLALWLASAAQMGVAPTSMTLIHQCQLRWPGFELPQDCYLFRFEYRFAGQSYANIGLAGPVTHAFACNLEHLDPVVIYSAFAGWQSQHEDIYIVDAQRGREAMPGVAESLARRLHSEFEQPREAFFGFFFETTVLMAIAESGENWEQPVVVAIDRNQSFAVPRGSEHAPITPEFAFEIYKGRELLQAFNEPDAFADSRDLDSE